MKRLLFFSILSVICFTVSSQNWVQVGNDMNGEADADTSARYASLSADGHTVAIGAPGNSDAGTYAGHVRVYTYDGASWLQKGSDIDGEAQDDYSGPVGISADGNTVAIGAPRNDDAGDNFGNVRVFDFNGTNWIQRGASIPGETTNGQSGTSVGISANGNRVVIGSPINGTGQVRVFEWNGSSWIKLGSNINGKATYDEFGTAVRISADGNTFIAGAPYSNSGGWDAGAISVYVYNGTDWEAKGDDIPGETAYGYFGHSVAISADGNTVISGESYYGNGVDYGRARVFMWNGSSWIQKGQNLDGLRDIDYYGSEVGMNNSGNIIAVRGNFDGDGNNYGQGRATMYIYNGTNWVQLGSSVNGESLGDDCGYALSFSASGDTIVIGSPKGPFETYQTFAGQARVFLYDGPLYVSENNLVSSKIYPNPTSGNFTIDLGKEYSDVSIEVVNMLGQVISSQKYSSAKKIETEIPGAAGAYFLKIATHREGSKTLRIIKN